MSDDSMAFVSADFLDAAEAAAGVGLFPNSSGRRRVACRDNRSLHATVAGLEHERDFVFLHGVTAAKTRVKASG